MKKNELEKTLCVFVGYLCFFNFPCIQRIIFLFQNFFSFPQKGSCSLKFLEFMWIDSLNMCLSVIQPY